MRMPIAISSILISVLTQACGPKIDTGRNEHPRDNTEGVAAGPDQGSDNPGGSGGNGGGNPSNGAGNNGNGGNLTGVACFTAETKALPASLVQICRDYIQPNPLLAKIYEGVCVKGLFLASMDHPGCGWEGDQAKIKNFIYTYEREPESSGKDYEDVHATIIHLPVPAAKAIAFVRLVFEDFNQFKAEGYKWIAGTRESTNQNGGKLETGVIYKFRVDKDVYELGYSGRIQIFQIDSKTWLHVNYADRNFTRVKGIEQSTIYHDLPDGTSMMLKFEHKSIESKGLYRRAWAGAIELAEDLMTKCWSNSIKAKGR